MYNCTKFARECREIEGIWQNPGGNNESISHQMINLTHHSFIVGAEKITQPARTVLSTQHKPNQQLQE